MLREHGVVGKFVEFCGDGLSALSLRRPRDARQHGARVRRDARLLPGRRRDAALPAGHRPRRRHVALVERYTKAQGLFRGDGDADPDLQRAARARPRRVEPSAGRPAAPAGPRRARGGRGCLPRARTRARPNPARGSAAAIPIPRRGTRRRRCCEADVEVDHGSVVIAAITSCTNTSNPSVMVAAGLLARNAVERGLHAALGQDEPRAGLARRDRVPRARPGCSPTSSRSASTSSATAARPASATPARCRTRSPRRSREHDLVVVAVLSGNRNFEGRIHPQVRASYLASPPLVVAYALAGTHRHRPRRASRSGTGTRRPARATCTTSGRRRRRSRDGRRREHLGRALRAASTRTICDGDERWRAHRRARRASCSPGTRQSTYVRSRRSSATCPPSPRRSGRRRRARARRAGRLGHDRPHLAGGRHPARAARPGST